MIGIGLVLSSAIIFSWFVMGSGVMTQLIGSAHFTAYTMTVACVATLVHFAYRHGAALTGLPADVYSLALIMAVFSTVLPTYAESDAGSASIISTTGPIATLVLAYMLLGEAITPIQIAGTFFVLAGVYMVSRVKLDSTN